LQAKDLVCAIILDFLGDFRNEVDSKRIWIKQVMTQMCCLFCFIILVTFVGDSTYSIWV
jgi:hypothetical protein